MVSMLLNVTLGVRNPTCRATVSHEPALIVSITIFAIVVLSLARLRPDLESGVIVEREPRVDILCLDPIDYSRIPPSGGPGGGSPRKETSRAIRVRAG